MKTTHNYTEKSLFVGVDVHKKTYSVAAYCEGELVSAQEKKLQEFYPLFIFFGDSVESTSKKYEMKACLQIDLAKSLQKLGKFYVIIYWTVLI